MNAQRDAIEPFARNRPPTLEDLTRWRELSRICKAVYAGPVQQNHYSYGGNPLRGQKIVHGFFGRGYCRVFWNEEAVIIAFRGTRENVDWSVSNLKMYPVPLRIGDREAGGVHVHRGFQRTLEAIDKTRSLSGTDAIDRHLREMGLLNRSVTITGHSLGGALATLYAVNFRSRYPEVATNKLREVVTFGAPAVGADGFKQYYRELNEKTIRLVNGSDVVPFTPPIWYRHVGRQIWLGPSGKIGDPSWIRRLASSLRVSKRKRFVSDHALTCYGDRLLAAMDARHANSVS